MMPSRFRLAVMGAVVTLGLNTAAMAQTAQSVQVNIEGVEQSYQIEGKITYAYTAAFDTYFTVTIVGSLNDSQINVAKNECLAVNKCNFWSGKSLVEFKRTFGISRSVTCTPISPGEYPAKTGFTVTDLKVGDPIKITLENVFIASESVLLKKATGKEPWSKKYSFSLNGRVEDLKIDLLKDGEVFDTSEPDFSYVNVSDWEYEANAGAFGNDKAKGSLLDGLVSNILLSDDFTGNNGAGGEQAVVGEVPLQLINAEGVYTIRISGIVKGNSASLDQSFSVTKSILTIGGCD